MEIWAVLLLVAALLLFLLSTKQWGVGVRLSIWLLGAGALTASAYLGADSQKLWQRILSDEVSFETVARVVTTNSVVIADYAAPFLDVLFVLSAVAAIAGLVALTPGERVERSLRPVVTGILGAIGGGALALLIVTIGFGGPTKRRTYIGHGSTITIIDGDSFHMGEFSLRLAGIDAPESHQLCRGEARMCGEAAMGALRELLKNTTVTCHRPTWLQDSDENRPPSETFGRPTVQCETGDGVDVAQHLARNGHAIEYRGQSGYYRRDVAHARAEGLGMWGSCTLRPDRWRDPEARRLFEAGELPADVSERVGCTP